MMRTTFLFVLVLTFVTTLTGCGRIQNERFTGGASALPDPVEITVSVSDGRALKLGTPAEARITISENGAAVTGATLTVEGNMTHAGMQPIFSSATETVPGEYRATLEWTMGGEWLLIVRGALPDGTPIEERVDGLTVES